MEVERKLSRTFLERHPGDAAAVLETLTPEVTATLLSELSPAAAAEILRRSAPHFAASVCAALDITVAGAMIEALPLEIASSFLRRMPEEAREHVLSEASKRTETLRSMLRFPDGTAGAWMDPHVIALPEDLTVKEALLRVRRAEERIIYNLYVVDRTQLLVGVLNLGELYSAEDQTRLAEIMQDPVHRIPAFADAQEILSHPGWRRLSSLPVVDEGRVYLGAIRHHALKRIEEESRAGTDAGATTVQALGDLFWTGIGGLFEAIAQSVAPVPRDPTSSRE